MIEKVNEFTCDVGMEIVKSSLQKTHDSRKIRKDIIKFVEDRQELTLIQDNCFNEIDYQGYLDYIRTYMLDEIKEYICTVDYKRAEELKKTIMAKASSYERKSPYPDGSIQFITENCINIMKMYYEGKLDGNDKLLAHITVHSILNPIIPKLDKIDKKISEIKEILRKQDDDISSEDVNEIPIRAFHLIYCVQDIPYAEELKEWLERNSLEYDECCYEDENSAKEDAVNYLGKNKILILIVGESFLRNIHCVYGLAEIIKSENSMNYMLPVVIDNSILGELSRIQCIAYWEKRETELRTTLGNLEKVQHAYKLVSENLVKYERTAQAIDELLVWMSKHSYNMGEIKGAIKKKVLM